MYGYNDESWPTQSEMAQTENYEQKYEDRSQQYYD